MLAVVITDAAREGEFQFQKRKLGATASQLRDLRQWLTEHQVRVAVMESTAQLLEAGLAGTGRTLRAAASAGPLQSSAERAQAGLR